MMKIIHATDHSAHMHYRSHSKIKTPIPQQFTVIIQFEIKCVERPIESRCKGWPLEGRRQPLRKVQDCESKTKGTVLAARQVNVQFVRGLVFNLINLGFSRCPCKQQRELMAGDPTNTGNYWLGISTTYQLLEWKTQPTVNVSRQVSQILRKCLVNWYSQRYPCAIEGLRPVRPEVNGTFSLNERREQLIR